MQVLYRLTSPTDRVYVGQTRNLKARLANYRSIARGKGGKAEGHQPLIYRSLRKYGFDNHAVDILHRFPDEVSQEVIDDYERYAIQMHKNMRGLQLLNVSPGGCGTPPRTLVRPLSRPDVQGENHPLAKLTELDVTRIREEYEWGSSQRGIRALAQKYNVSQRLIYNVVKGKAWTHVPDVRNQPRRTMSRLTLHDAAKIRERYKNGGCTHRSLAAEYGVGHETIGDIIRNLDWGRVHAARVTYLRSESK